MLYERLNEMARVLGFFIGMWIFTFLAVLIRKLRSGKMKEQLTKQDLIDKRDYFLNRSGQSWGITGILFAAMVYAADSTIKTNDLFIGLITIFTFILTLVFLLSSYFSSIKFVDYHERLTRMKGIKTDIYWWIKAMLGRE